MSETAWSQKADIPTSVRKRILLSAFACSPLWGSEPGVGWRWLQELVGRHDVTLVTHAFFRRHIEPELERRPLPALSVVYVDTPAFGMHSDRYLNSRVYYVWWQLQLRRKVARLLAASRFDLIHHLTWGTFRFPCFLGRMGVPLVMGPLGGGESAPLRLMRSLPFKARAFDALRTATLALARFDPLATWGPTRSAFVLCRTSETLKALPRAVQRRAGLASDVGAPGVDIFERPAPLRTSPLHLLFAGRLIGWKGVSLAIGALHRLRMLGIDARLDIAGVGSLRGYLEAKAHRLGLDEHVCFRGSLPRDELFRLYGQADLFLFPSLHDAGGSVVLEALSRGLPVVCLDLGGPKHFVDASCGAVVSTRGLDEPEVEAALAHAVAELSRDRARLERLRDGAAAQAARMTWAYQVETAYRQIGQALGWHEAASAIKA